MWRDCVYIVVERRLIEKGKNKIRGTRRGEKRREEKIS